MVMTLTCPNCRHVFQITDKLKETILSQLHSPVDTYMVKCSCGEYEWAIGARDVDAKRD